jgi:DNA topoisomerase-2
MDAKDAKDTKDAINAKYTKDDDSEGDITGQGYKYLLKLPMDSVSEENVKKLLNEKERKEKELEELSSKTAEQMWLKDLEELEVGYSAFMEATIYADKGESGSKVSGGVSSLKVKNTKQGKN